MDWSIILKVIGSIILGGLVGLERELAAKPAGLRTHMLVAGAATLFMVLGDVTIQKYAGSALTDAIRADPIRIMEAIITGISFLGAGTIIFKNQQSTVEGLTTAASILFVSAIGIAVSLDKFLMAAVLTVIVIAILFALGYVEGWIDRLRKKTSYPKQSHKE